MAKFDVNGSFARNINPVVSASGLQFTGSPDAPNKNTSASPDKVSQNIFKTRRCPKNLLLKQKRRRKSSQRGGDDPTSSLFTLQESTKITNLIADLDSTMHFLVPRPI